MIDIIIYTDLYFKKYIRDIILKNIDTNKYYKSYIIKKNMLEFNQGKRDPMYISENMIQIIYYMILKI